MSRAEGTEEVQPELVPAAVSLLLGTLPERWVPSRGFVTVCAELAIALSDAWLMAYVTAGPDASPRAEELQEQLDSLAGLECSRGWWADAAERAGKEGSDGKRPASGVPGMANCVTSDGSRGAGGGGGGYQFEMHALVASLVRRSIASVRSNGQRSNSKGAVNGNASSGLRSSGVAAGNDQIDAWLRFGTFWVLCALDDIIGSVISHCARKAAMPRVNATAAQRPASRGSASRPGTAGSRPGTAGSQPTAGNKLSKDAVSTRPATGARPGTSSGTGARDAQQPAERCMERPRLLALKHFVAAARNDDGLKACQILEACLVEVATGQTPHVATAELLAIEPYQQRLMSWVEQESGPDASEDAKKVALAQAMKGVPLKDGPPSVVASSPATARGKTTPSPSATKIPGAQPSPDSAGSSQARRSWLPKAFVHEFNAEGEEVEPDVLSDVSDAEAKSPPRLGAADATGAARTAGYADKAQVDPSPPQPQSAAPPRPVGNEPRRATRTPGTAVKTSTKSAHTVRRPLAPVTGGHEGYRQARVSFTKVPESR